MRNESSRKHIEAILQGCKHVPDYSLKIFDNRSSSFIENLSITPVHLAEFYYDPFHDDALYLHLVINDENPWCEAGKYDIPYAHFLYSLDATVLDMVASSAYLKIAPASYKIINFSFTDHNGRVYAEFSYPLAAAAVTTARYVSAEIKNHLIQKYPECLEAAPGQLTASSAFFEDFQTPSPHFPVPSKEDFTKRTHLTRSATRQEMAKSGLKSNPADKIVAKQNTSKRIKQIKHARVSISPAPPTFLQPLNLHLNNDSAQSISIALFELIPYEHCAKTILGKVSPEKVSKTLLELYNTIDTIIDASLNLAFNSFSNEAMYTPGFCIFSHRIDDFVAKLEESVAKLATKKTEERSNLKYLKFIQKIINDGLSNEEFAPFSGTTLYEYIEVPSSTPSSMKQNPGTHSEEDKKRIDEAITILSDYLCQLGEYINTMQILPTHTPEECHKILCDRIAAYSYGLGYLLKLVNISYYAPTSWDDGSTYIYAQRPMNAEDAAYFNYHLPYGAIGTGEQAVERCPHVVGHFIRHTISNFVGACYFYLDYFTKVYDLELILFSKTLPASLYFLQAVPLDSVRLLSKDLSFTPNYGASTEYCFTSWLDSWGILLQVPEKLFDIDSVTGNTFSYLQAFADASIRGFFSGNNPHVFFQFFNQLENYYGWTLKQRQIYFDTDDLSEAQLSANIKFIDDIEMHERIEITQKIAILYGYVMSSYNNHLKSFARVSSDNKIIFTQRGDLLNQRLTEEWKINKSELISMFTPFDEAASLNNLSMTQFVEEEETISESE